MEIEGGRFIFTPLKAFLMNTHVSEKDVLWTLIPV